MLKRFVALREDIPGRAWLARFNAARNETEAWYLGEGRDAPPTPKECRVALRRYMPELLPPYDHVCALVGDDERAHQVLSHYRPAPIAFGCTQTVWLGSGRPALIRNYDYPIEIVSNHFESTSWFDRPAIRNVCDPRIGASGLTAADAASDVDRRTNAPTRSATPPTRPDEILTARVT